MMRRKTFPWAGAVGLLALLALRVGRGVAELDASQEDDSKSFGGMALFPIAILIAGGWGIWTELEALSQSSVVFRLVGIVLAVAIALAGRDLLLRMNHVALAWCLGGAAATLLALGGIDMLFTQPGSVAIAWAFLGAFSCARVRGKSRPAWRPTLRLKISGFSGFFWGGRTINSLISRTDVHSFPIPTHI